MRRVIPLILCLATLNSVRQRAANGRAGESGVTRTDSAALATPVATFPAIPVEVPVRAVPATAFTTLAPQPRYLHDPGAQNHGLVAPRRSALAQHARYLITGSTRRLATRTIGTRGYQSTAPPARAAVTSQLFIHSTRMARTA
jgi:hypothetical protein